MSTQVTATLAPPKNNLVRLLVPGDGLERGLELRDLSDGTPTMFGHFAVFGRWTEIDSFFEGRFMEQFTDGAFKRTFREDAERIKSIFQHGRDMQIGMKPLGPIDVLREDKGVGAYYEVPLLDAPYARETLLPGLRANLYGASFKFRVMREEIVDDPGASDHNPNGIPERTVKEARLYEFGPVTFPAYVEASAGIRSGTDDYFLEGLMQADPECVRAAAEFSRDHAPFSVFIAERLGMNINRPERTDAPAAAAAEQPAASNGEGGGVNAEREQQVAAAVRSLTDAGFDPESVTRAVEAGDVALLERAAEPEPEAAAADGESNTDERGDKAGGPAPTEDQPATNRAAQDPAVRGTTPLLGPDKEPWRL